MLQGHKQIPALEEQGPETEVSVPAPRAQTRLGGGVCPSTNSSGTTKASKSPVDPQPVFCTWFYRLWGSGHMGSSYRFQGSGAVQAVRGFQEVKMTDDGQEGRGETPATGTVR